MKRLLLLFALVLLPAVASAQRWESKQARRDYMTQLAQRHGLTQASWNTTEMLNRRFGSSLQPHNVYYTTWGNFLSFANEAKNVALGAAYVDHGVGPHGHLVVGEHVRDSIDPGIVRAFGNGQKTRERWLLRGEWGARVFALWKAPVESLTSVGVESGNAVRNLAQCGMNCVAMVNGHLRREARVHSDNHESPFYHLRGEGWPHEGAEAMFGADPDIVIQVLDDPSYWTIRSNHENHPIKPWGNAY